MNKFFTVVIAVTVCASCVQTNSHPDYNDKKSVQLYIKNFSSSVTQISADLISDDIKIIGDTGGETYVIVRTYGSGIAGMSIDNLQARVEKYYDIQIRQSGADGLDINVRQKVNNISNAEGLAFYFEVHTGVSSSVKIKNVSGNIEASRIYGAKVSAVSGDIHLENVSGSADASTTSGDIEGDNIATINNASSVSGDIKMKVNSLLNDAAIKTTSGNIHLYIPSEVRANIDFSSMSGNVKLNDFSSVNYIKKEDNKATGSINGGGKSLSIHSTSGDIIIN